MQLPGARAQGRCDHCPPAGPGRWLVKARQLSLWQTYAPRPPNPASKPSLQTQPPKEKLTATGLGGSPCTAHLVCGACGACSCSLLGSGGCCDLCTTAEKAIRGNIGPAGGDQKLSRAGRNGGEQGPTLSAARCWRAVDCLWKVRVRLQLEFSCGRLPRCRVVHACRACVAGPASSQGVVRLPINKVEHSADLRSRDGRALQGTACMSARFLTEALQHRVERRVPQLIAVAD
jgi:hypothetical protein